MVYNEEEINILREGGMRLGRILKEASQAVKPGASTKDIDALIAELIEKIGDTPAFLGYQPAGASRPFPASSCVSVNEEVVHGIPNEKPRRLKEGDIVTIDIGLLHRGLVADAAVTVPVGTIDAKGKALLETAREALQAAVTAVKAGATTGDIGSAVEKAVKKGGFAVVRELGGHGVGHGVHEEPFIPNFGTPGKGERLLPGMVLALEPIVAEGKGAVELDSDGYTYRTVDGSRSAQYEHTVVVTKDGAEVLTSV